MTRPFERQAMVVALVNGIVVYLLPLAFAAAVSLLAADSSNGGTRVVGVDPDRALVWSRRVTATAAYLVLLAPLGFAAAWRTFVHAKRWLQDGSWGLIGIAEAGACGFAGSLLVLLPSILTRPAEAPPYVLAYGGLAAVVGLCVGAVLWVTATIALKISSPTLPGR